MYFETLNIEWSQIDFKAGGLRTFNVVQHFKDSKGEEGKNNITQRHRVSFIL